MEAWELSFCLSTGTSKHMNMTLLIDIYNSTSHRIGTSKYKRFLMLRKYVQSLIPYIAASLSTKKLSRLALIRFYKFENYITYIFEKIAIVTQIYWGPNSTFVFWRLCQQRSYRENTSYDFIILNKYATYLFAYHIYIQDKQNHVFSLYVQVFRYPLQFRPPTYWVTLTLFSVVQAGIHW